MSKRFQEPMPTGLDPDARRPTPVSREIVAALTGRTALTTSVTLALTGKLGDPSRSGKDRRRIKVMFSQSTTSHPDVDNHRFRRDFLSEFAALSDIFCSSKCLYRWAYLVFGWLADSGTGEINQECHSTDMATSPTHWCIGVTGSLPIDDHRLSTSCAVIEQPDHLCGDDLVF